jgi:hypothetical protein
MQRILSLCAILLVSGWCVAQNSADLKLNLEKNKVYRFSSVSEQTIAQTVNGVQQNVESKTNYVLSLRMMDATPDFLVTEIRFDTMKITTNTMGKVSVINSASEGNIAATEAADIMSYFFNRFSKNSLYVKMDLSGKVMEIVNAKMFSSIVLKDTSSITLTGPVAAAIKSQAANMFSDQALKTMIEAFTWNLPAKGAPAGNTWTNTQKMYSGGMTLDITTSYKLDGVKENAALITAQADIKAAQNAEPIHSGGATITFDDLKGMSKLNLVIDTRTGLPAENSAKTRISGNLGVSMPGMSMQIPMEINGESKVKAIQ